MANKLTIHYLQKIRAHVRGKLVHAVGEQDAVLTAKDELLSHLIEKATGKPEPKYGISRLVLHDE